MPDKKTDLDLFHEEFTAAGEVAKQVRRLSMTPPVDDDFPQVKHEYDSSVRELVRKAVAYRGESLEHLRDVAATSPPDSISHIMAVNLARCERWHKGGLDSWSVADWGVAFEGEAGEIHEAAIELALLGLALGGHTGKVADIIKKLNRVRDGMPGNKKNPAQLTADLADEIADTFLYMLMLSQKCGINFQLAVQSKFNSVSHRVGFPERL